MWDQGFPHACLRGDSLTHSQLRDMEGQEAATGKPREGYYSPRIPSDTCTGSHKRRERCTLLGEGSCQKALRKLWAQLFPLEKASHSAGWDEKATPKGERCLGNRGAWVGLWCQRACPAHAWLLCRPACPQPSPPAESHVHQSAAEAIHMVMKARTAGFNGHSPRWGQGSRLTGPGPNAN